jgi:glycosyltransferase involved in cell wall biosynthesis
MSLFEFSIITCSNDDSKFASLNDSAARTFGPDVQLIRIQGARSLAEGYNLGFREAKSSRIIFCHDDIVFLNTDIASIVAQDLESYDMVGVAGTSRIVDGKWISSGQPYLHGQVAHVSKGKEAGYQLCSYGLGRDNAIIENIQALDGLFIGANRSVFDALRFDEQSFDGFHLYDLDFTFTAYLLGFRIAIDSRIHLLHHSDGRYDNEWETYAKRFCGKYHKVLPKMSKNTSMFIKRKFSKTLDSIRNEMLRNSKQ